MCRRLQNRPGSRKAMANGCLGNAFDVCATNQDSGALMAILSSICVQFPETPLQIVFLPFFTFTASNAIKAIMALDFVGLVAKWRLFDHAAHLGGAIYGILYLNYGTKYIWNNREPIFSFYHKLREKKE
ncbi:Presenilins-associated rhomboid-like protein, mitochondrial [Araneus ventricosus]|uniref:rhomboid protease n=1 Tax=Araneus ventricosus TaxID=182803 RepID=A0A4Y2GNL2_ARAVE|nr:Presenilins-associated rhomboid-like protein, mitochondrial [Araneus ventricosus]